MAVRNGTQDHSVAPLGQNVSARTAYYALCRLRVTPEDLEGLVDRIENPPPGPVHPNFPANQDVASHLLSVLGQEAKSSAPRVRKLLREGQFDQRVVNRLNTFLGEL